LIDGKAIIGAGVGFGAITRPVGLTGRSTNRLKQISRSSSSFKKRQSVTTFAGGGFSFGSGGTIAS
jgi:hypothetical protein